MTTGAMQIAADSFQKQRHPTIGKVSRFLVLMASISLASKIIEWLVSRAVLPDLSAVGLGFSRVGGMTN